MQFSPALLAVALCFNVSLGSIVTHIDYVTRYEHQQVNVLVDDNGKPWSTQTLATGDSFPAQSSTPAKTSSSSNDDNYHPSHTHHPVPNYQRVTATPETSAPAPSPSSTDYTSSSSSVAPWTPSTSSTSSAPGTNTPAAPAPAASSSSTTAAPAPAPTSTPEKTTSSAPEPTSSAPGGGSGQTFNGDATYYDVGLGACGVTNSDSELIAALNVNQFNSFGSMSNGNPVCGKKATLHYQGKSVTVTIQDKCPGCKYGDLDLSPAAFTQLADKAAGRIHVTWSFDN